ncbi:MAG: MBL fold metallo-hydrolase [Candidatus Krumholzibacteria bacterium]|nr:MBL fold metallo-hydrolase [Candidatus Krumholzibacteria bacterium]
MQRRAVPALLLSLVATAGPSPAATNDSTYVVVLGVAQDGGVPQAGTAVHPGWDDLAKHRTVACLAIVDARAGKRWLIDCTPDFPEQLHALDTIAPARTRPGLDGIFLTHAHIGHYAGLVHLGHEVMGARGVPVYAMPRMAEFLENNGPWDQLVRYENVALRVLEDGQPVALGADLAITPLRVPHRQEYAEVVAYRIQGPNRSVLYIPDIDSWTEWDASGTHIEDQIARVDVAYLDGTFFDNGEIPGRDMSSFPHPFIANSMSRLAALSAAERAKVRFIHMNHTNPALWPESDARHEIEKRGFGVAEEMERVGL